MKRLQHVLTALVVFFIASTAGIALYVQFQEDSAPVVRDESTAAWAPGWLEAEGFGQGGGKIIDLDEGGINSCLADIYILMPVPLMLCVGAWVLVDWRVRRSDRSEDADHAAGELHQHVDQHG